MRFSMALRLGSAELATLAPLEQNCARHISVVNDIFSWDKEVRASQERDTEGAALCSAVGVLAAETGLDFAATKRVLWPMVREWERVHERLVGELVMGAGPTEKVPVAVREYIKGLEFQMTGNEMWSMTTPRYREVI